MKYVFSYKRFQSDAFPWYNFIGQSLSEENSLYIVLSISLLEILAKHKRTTIYSSHILAQLEVLLNHLINLAEEPIKTNYACIKVLIDLLLDELDQKYHEIERLNFLYEYFKADDDLVKTIAELMKNICYKISHKFTASDTDAVFQILGDFANHFMINIDLVQNDNKNKTKFTSNLTGELPIITIIFEENFYKLLKYEYVREDEFVKREGFPSGSIGKLIGKLPDSYDSCKLPNNSSLESQQVGEDSLSIHKLLEAQKMNSIPSIVNTVSIKENNEANISFSNILSSLGSKSKINEENKEHQKVDKDSSISEKRASLEESKSSYIKETNPLDFQGLLNPEEPTEDIVNEDIVQKEINKIFIRVIKDPREVLNLKRLFEQNDELCRLDKFKEIYDFCCFRKCDICKCKNDILLFTQKNCSSFCSICSYCRKEDRDTCSKCNSKILEFGEISID